MTSTDQDSKVYKKFIVSTRYGNLKTVAVSSRKAVSNVRYRLRREGLFLGNDYEVMEVE